MTVNNRQQDALLQWMVKFEVHHWLFDTPLSLQHGSSMLQKSSKSPTLGPTSSGSKSLGPAMFRCLAQLTVSRTNRSGVGSFTVCIMLHITHSSLYDLIKYQK